MRFLAIVTLCCAALGQNAPTVVPLLAPDAQQAREIHQRMLDAEKKWDEFQKMLGEKYLIVNNGDPNASDTRWYAKDSDNTGFTTISAGSLSVASVVSVASDGTLKYVPERCLTQEERDAIKARELQEEKDRKDREAVRESKSRRFRKGFERNILHSFDGDEPQYIFSDDYSYLLPKAEEPSKPSPWLYTPAIANAN